MYRSLTISVIISIALLLLGCQEEIQTLEGSETLFKLVPTKTTGIDFNNRVVENDTFNMVDFFYVYNGGGVAVGDINNDNLPDIFFTGNMVNDRLYLNKGNLEFEDISDTAGITIQGWSTGATMVDINHDGLLDIYVSRSGNYASKKRKNLFYINLGNLKFEERAESFGLADTSYSTQAAFFDYDKDGDLDMYLLNHTNDIQDPNNVKSIKKDGSGPANDRLFRNNEVETSEISFTDITLQAGILYDGLGLGVGTADINEDGWEDIFVTNDFIANDYLYINKQDGTFKEISATYFAHNSHFSMGNDLADFNNDGRIDAITLDMLPNDNYHQKKMAGPMNNDLFNYSLKLGFSPQNMRNTLQLNRGRIDSLELGFSEIGQLSGISATDWSWSPLFADFDNDGWKDLFITNGYLRDITDLDFINYTASLAANTSIDSLDSILKEKAKQMPSLELSNVMYQNSGDLTFKNVSKEWGFDQPTLSNGAAYADLDLDGDLDIVINNINSEVSVYENLLNATNNYHFLRIRLEGDELNPEAIGARLTIFQNGKTQTFHQSLTRGYQSSKEAILHVGLGKSSIVDSLIVKWPDGITATYIDNIAVDAPFTVSRKEGIKSSESANIEESVLFTEVTDRYNLGTIHQNIEYEDFDRQFLLPHKHSDQGPGIAVADINGDGLDDFFMGAGYGSSGTLFYQTASGSFIKKPLISNADEKYEEDTGVLFFDYDNDGDNDLYIASGSNEFYENSEYFQDRLYKNNGKGEFSLDESALPPMRSSTSCVRASDFDKDGDLDLFVGGRLTPLKYPIPPTSYLLINVNGKFENRTKEIASGLSRVGMATDALWTDWDNDLDTDLIIVGEFMSIQFFKNEEGILKNVSDTASPSFTSGWWNSINGGDIDNDGDIDYILGNLGHNTRFKASKKEPLSVYALDYDSNGIIDPIISYYIEGEEYPAASRDLLLKQIPELKKRYPNYASYAKATMEDILPKTKRSNAFIAKAFLFTSGYLENKGNSQFEFKALPIEAQFAPVNGILLDDFNADGNIDILLSGNKLGAEVTYGRYDASKGLYLKGNGEGGFEAIENSKSGININGDSRGVSKIVINGVPTYLFGSNSEPLKAYTYFTDNRVLNLPQNTLKAKITYRDGSKRLYEFYYGSSFLSQSKNFILLNGNEESIELYDLEGNKNSNLNFTSDQ